MLRSARLRFRCKPCIETDPKPRLANKRKPTYPAPASSTQLAGVQLYIKVWGHRIEFIVDYTLPLPCIPHTGELTIYQVASWRNRPWASAISH